MLTPLCATRQVDVWLPGAVLLMLHVSAAEQVLSALEKVTRTDEVRRNLDLELFELALLDSLGVVEMLVLLSDALKVELSPAEFDREEWATPRRILASIEARLGP